MSWLEKTNERVPISAMGKPQAADVATAFFIEILNQYKNGTVIVPPPIPTTVEIKPMMVPPAVAMDLLISVLCCEVFLFRSRLVATENSKKIKTNLK